MYQKILVPHAGTKAGDEALKHAIHIAKMESSKIMILNVIPPWPTTFDEYQDSSIDDQINSLMTHMKEGARKFFAKRVAQCREEGLECEGVFKIGKPATSIVQYANDENFDLIIMSKQKKHADYKSFFKIGGTVKKVQEKADCSILLVET